MSSSARFKVLYVCIGNSCRSPMAEAISTARHSDILEAASAGIAPASVVQPLTYAVLQEIGVEPEGMKPVHLERSNWRSMDVIVNMSGEGILPMIPGYKGSSVIWAVTDPIGRSPSVYRDVRDRIVKLVEHLANSLRQQPRPV